MPKGSGIPPKPPAPNRLPAGIYILIMVPVFRIIGMLFRNRQT